MTHPEGYTEEYFYDAAGRMAAVKDADGNVVERAYDGPVRQFRVSSFQFPEGGGASQATTNCHCAQPSTASACGGGRKNSKPETRNCLIAAGNRTSLMQWNNAGINKTATSTYGNREQPLTTGSYYMWGALTGNVTYAFDNEGNMTSRNQPGIFTTWTYSWNEDNRLTQVKNTYHDLEGDIDTITQYAYDNGGRRILRRASDGTRARYFFTGLTEGVRKTSIGTPADNSFRFTNVDDGSLGFSTWTWSSGGTVTSTYDTARRSNVLAFSRSACMSGSATSSMTLNDSRRGASFWVKNLDTSCAAVVGFRVTTSAGTRYIEFSLAAGTNAYNGATQTYTVYLNANNTTWQRVERDLSRVVSTLTPGVTFSAVTQLYANGKSFRLDDVRLSNSMTSEVNVLAPGSIAHIVRHREIATIPSTPVVTDYYFHYDQVGSVLAETNASGAVAWRNDQDSFGNVQDTWQSGLWGGGVMGGWHHNTKEYDLDAQLVYMYQRWYLPETGEFLSRARLDASKEPSYQFADQQPTARTDPLGLVTLERAMRDCAEDWGKNYKPPDGFACRSGAGNGCESMKQCLAFMGFGDANVTFVVEKGIFHDVCYVTSPQLRCSLERTCIWRPGPDFCWNTVECRAPFWGSF